MQIITTAEAPYTLYIYSSWPTQATANIIETYASFFCNVPRAAIEVHHIFFFFPQFGSSRPLALNFWKKMKQLTRKKPLMGPRYTTRVIIKGAYVRRFVTNITNDAFNDRGFGIRFRKPFSECLSAP